MNCWIITPNAAMGPTMKALAEGHRAMDCPACVEAAAARADTSSQDVPCACGHRHGGDCELCPCNEFDPRPPAAIGGPQA